jgi:3-hydroxyacyl-CoA dehydrogenase
MVNRNIRKVAVLGSGIMGSRIACHFAGIGLQVLLLDIVPNEAKDSENKTVRNKLVNDALQAAIKSNPSPLYAQDAAKKITTGNFDDNLKDIASYDWVIEVVIERLDIKRSLYEKIEGFRKPGTVDNI